MRYALIALSLLLGTATPAIGQVGISVSVPGVSIGIHLPSYPELVLVPGYPVYYAPQVQANYFFYDGLYWVYQDDNWYSSAWYNGPWELVEPDYVPLFVLRVPVRYYINPPVFFFGWYVEAAPRWDYHWGHRWTRYHHGWDRWDRRVVYAPAPLPVYQRHYAGDRYPRAEYQHVIRREHYQYQPRDRIVRERDQQRATPRLQAPAQQGSQGRPDFPRAQQPPRPHDDVRRPETAQIQSGGPVVREQRQQPRQDTDRRAPAPAQSAPQSSTPVPHAGQAPREREDERRSARTEAPPQSRSPATQVQPPQVRQEAGPRMQSAAREDTQRSVRTEAPTQQRSPATYEQRQQLRQEAGPRAQTPDRVSGAQQAPGPQQTQERGPQVRSESNQPRTNPERRQGPGQERGRGRDGDRPAGAGKAS